MSLFKGRFKYEAEIPTASMADIAFLLIIFFMVTTIFSRDRGLKIILPEKSEERVIKIKKENLLSIFINPEGKIFFKEELTETPFSMLREKIKNEILNNPDKIVIFIKTNVNSVYNIMIDVFDEVLLSYEEVDSIMWKRGLLDKNRNGILDDDEKIPRKISIKGIGEEI
ncbi:MAG: biopolymer transporter ExbD [Candidatus Hydrothermales bacterium]